MLGDLALACALVTALGAWPFLAMGKPHHREYALTLLALHGFSTGVATGYLLHALLTHQFQYSYVFAHSNLGMARHYLVAALWAGQEGTLLFWALLGVLVIVGLFLREGWTVRRAAAILLLFQTILLVLLLVENPFTLVSGPPTDGAGLNPLLLNPWMVVHPPVIFAGYALLAVPCALALAGLWQGDYGIFHRAQPWALAGWLLLGAGIILGGVWAYRVLGWGGYWGWDPVENASLIPWLTGAALVHGLRWRRPGLMGINLALAIGTFVLVLVATFLTRSGIMAAYSVHAFADTRLTWFLGTWPLALSVVGLSLLLWRWPRLPKGTIPPVQVLALATMVAGAALVFLGTLSPVFTGWWGTPAVVDQSFYYLTTGPVAVAMAILLVMVNKGLRLPAVLGAVLVTAALAVFLGMANPLHLIFSFATSLALLQSLAALAGGRWFQKGGPLAHGGLALLLLGVLASTSYTTTEIIRLSPGEESSALGYSFRYQGAVADTDGTNYPLAVTTTGGTVTAEPRMYLAGRDARLFREPAVVRNPWRDLYLSPLETRTNPGEGVFVLGRGESFTSGDYQVTFQGFSFTAHGLGEPVAVGAVLEVAGPGRRALVVPTLGQEATGEWVREPVQLPHGTALTLTALNATEGLAQLRLGDPATAGEEQLLVEIKEKPLIMAVALGAVLLLVGTMVATGRRLGAELPPQG